MGRVDLTKWVRNEDGSYSRIHKKAGEPVVVEKPANFDYVSVEGDVEEEIRASSAAKDLAEELGVDLAFVKGTGKDGRITKGDVQVYAAG